MRKYLLFLFICISASVYAQNDSVLLKSLSTSMVRIDGVDYPRALLGAAYTVLGGDSVTQINYLGKNAPYTLYYFRKYNLYKNGDASNAPFTSNYQLQTWMTANLETTTSGGGGGSGTVTSVTAGAGLSGGTITTSGTIGIDTTKIDYCVYNSGRLAAQTGSLTLTYTPTVALGNYRLVFFLNARNNGTTAGTVTYTNGAGTLQSLIPMQRARNQTIPFTLAWTSGEGQTYPVIFSATNATPITIVITAAAADYDAQFWIYKMPN